MVGMLRRGSRGPDVETLQRKLNCRSPTRLPRLVPDQDYGVITMARVMEFQHQQGLTADGICGPNTFGRLNSTPTACTNASPPSGRCIVVDFYHRKLTAYENGTSRLVARPIYGGSNQDPSHRGVFQMSNRRLRHHTSAQYPIPPDNMQFALYYNGGEAIHLGPPDVPSHGCIHVGDPYAEQLFNWAGMSNIVVIVAKDAP